MHVVDVSLKKRSYSILVEENLLPDLGSQCAKLELGSRCAIITDTNVARRYSAVVQKSLRESGFEPALVTIPAGEKSKRLSIVERCCDKLAAQRLERKSFVVALGGGVVGDLAGFVAASYLRGIPYIQVPTTLLAQVDSSVGGKVGVNLRAGKNLVGAFYQPRLVLCDLRTLRTLPLRESRAGLAEVIKYGIIYDAALFGRLERDMPKLLKQQPADLEEVVTRCCEIKAEVVAKDEDESSLRAILNFGHTIGHAIEASAGFGKLLHGEAISIGQVAAARISTLLSGLTDDEADRIEALFRAAGLPTHLQFSRTQFKRLVQAMSLDKKVSDGEIKFVLAERIGRVQWGQKVPLKVIEQVLMARR